MIETDEQERARLGAPAFELYEAMSELSEENWCAGWLIGCEFTLWSMVQDDALNLDGWTVSQEELDALRRLAAAADGWIFWNHRTMRQEFSTGVEWLVKFARGPKWRGTE